MFLYDISIHSHNIDSGDVPPLVGMVVPEADLNIAVAGYHGIAGNCANDSAGSVSQGKVIVAGTSRRDACTGKFASVVFIRQESLKAVGKRVDVVHPPRPAGHIVYRDCETSVDHDAHGDESNRHQRLVGCACDRGHGTVYARHDEENEEYRENEEEECSRFAAEIGEEVNNRIKQDSISNLVGKFKNVTRNCFGRLMIESISIVLLDNGSLDV